MIQFRSLPYRQGVGIVLLNEAGLMLAGERRGMGGAWQLPQGGIDEGEAANAAAFRELAEETGVTDATLLRITAEKHGYDFPRVYRDDKWRGQEQLWFALRFTGDAASIDVTAVDYPEFARHAWLTAAEMLTRIVAFKRPIYEKVFVEFADLLA